MRIFCIFGTLFVRGKKPEVAFVFVCGIGLESKNGFLGFEHYPPLCERLLLALQEALDDKVKSSVLACKKQSFAQRAFVALHKASFGMQWVLP